jgi:uncharacterized membrane protein YfcA
VVLESVGLYVWLGLAALTAGAVNSIAGGGTLLTFPALLTAVPPVVANGTSTVALVPGSLAGAWGFRRELHSVRRWVPLLAVPSLVGGWVGSRLVTRLPASYFDALVPWLILTASLLFLFQPILARQAAAAGPARPKARMVAAVVGFQFLVAVYGGYFGAGIGILMLSALGLMGLHDIHAMNGLKNFLAVLINGISVANFVLEGVVEWRLAAVMAPAAILGAYAAPHLARRLDRRLVRCIVVGIGFALAGHFFYQRWGAP